jgi:membrane associated rhomboid family serine protease
MIPIRDTIPSRSYPVVNTAIIIINVLVYLLELSKGDGLNIFIYVYGLVPARYTVTEVSNYFSFAQQGFAWVSFMFLHGGFLHLLGNMWSLYIFGDNVEEHLGSARYLAFYLLGGIISGLAHFILNPYSNAPTIGASGAIAGVMGAYFILHPRAKILTLIPIIIIPWFVEIPAFFFLGFWFVMQFINAAGSGAASSGIAWWAHIGGFVGGIILLKIFDFMPADGVTRKLKQMTTKKKSHRLQVIRPTGPPDTSDLFGTIAITPFEALTGTSKLVNIPWGFHKRLVRVAVPAGVNEGTTLRLRGMGKQMPGDQRGDLLLKVVTAEKTIEPHL